MRRRWCQFYRAKFWLKSLTEKFKENVVEIFIIQISATSDIENTCKFSWFITFWKFPWQQMNLIKLYGSLIYHLFFIAFEINFMLILFENNGKIYALRLTSVKWQQKAQFAVIRSSSGRASENSLFAFLCFHHVFHVLQPAFVATFHLTQRAALSLSRTSVSIFWERLAICLIRLW